MPPRRSSRSARPSVEPAPVESLPSKRKRGQTIDLDDTLVEEKENVVKPPSRTRRSSSTRPTVAPPAKGRASTRSRASLKEVPETDEEEEQDAPDSPPPVKKSRRSQEVAKRGSVASGISKASSTSARSGRSSTRSAKVAPADDEPQPQMEDEEEEEEEEEKVVPASKRGRKPSSKVPSASRANARASTSSAPQTSDPMEVSDDAKPTSKGHKSRSSVSARKTSARAPPSRPHAEEIVEDSDVSGNEGELEYPPKANPQAEMNPGSDGGGEEEEEEEEKEKEAEEEEEEEVLAEATNLDSGSAPEPEEDEQSLFEPQPTPMPASQPQVVVEEPKGPKSRLVIHKMALVNFKSYAGRQEIGPFHKSFSSIVGPNGSGKSNTIDALLFVFGYRASKMRQGKLSELIHNSARYPDLDDCSVEVHFREIVDLPGPDAFTVVPNSELVVTRQAFKNNSSRYTINKKASNYTEVQTLLKGRGIDLDHNRFLILQGEVESIAQMKPKAPSEHEDGLLEYLEDIIGTSKYKEPIEEALVEMERLQEDRGDKLNRLRVVEKEKNALEDKKREAEDYLRLQNEHVRAQSRLWQWYLWKCLLNEEEFEKKISKHEKELKDLTEQNKDDVTHCDMLKKHYEEREKAYEEVKAAAAEAVKDLAAHEKQEVGLLERRKHANGKAKKLKKSLQDDENAKAKAARAVEDSSEKMEKEKAKVDEYEASLVKEEKVLEGIRDSLKDKTQVFHDQIEVKQKELQPWTAKINIKQAEIDVASSERDALAKKAEAVREAGREASEALEHLQTDQEAKVAGLEELKANKANLQRQTKAGESNFKDMQDKVQNLRSKASSSRQKAEEARASQVASTSQNRVLDSLNRLKNQGRIQGFHGRLGSLGTIPDKYDVAISTACPALNNMVVDTVEQGQACIEYLRSQNVGRASFIVLEKLSRTNLDKIATPENVPRLFDLIKPKDPRFAPAFFKVVQNTLVAENLDQANRIAFGQRRWKVVTLIGQVIDVSGTMAGGGTSVARGGMSSKLAAEAVRPEVLRQYEKESEENSQLLDVALQELRAAEGELERLTRSGPQIDIALEKLALDIENGKRRIAEAEKRVRDLKSQSKPDAGDIARISALDKEMAASTRELEALQEKSGKIEKAIKDLEKKILDIGGSKLLTQKSKVDGIRLHINLANDEITKAEVAKAKAEKDSVKLNGSIEANAAALEEVAAELEELDGQLEELTAYVTELKGKVDAAQSAADNSKDDLETLKAELDEKNEAIQAFREKEMELKQLLSEAQKDSIENERTLDHWRMEHDKLKLEDIDEDDDEDEEEPEQTAEPVETAEGEVKPEPGVAGPSKPKARERTPPYELHIYSADELAKFKKREMVADTELLDEKLKNAKPNLSVLKEYRKREEEFFTRAKDLEEITNQRDGQKQKYDSLTKQRLDEFMAGFNLISMKLKEMYQMITLGGNAELELVDSMDPFSEGIIFSVMPPKKSWKNISNLSGGEKTLSSLALVFALHVFKPTPLYFMDEIDAALDFRNVSIVANYIKDRTKNAQFIIISLRNDMFELSHRLIGIYKTANATQSISINNHSLAAPPTPVAA